MKSSLTLSSVTLLGTLTLGAVLASSPQSADAKETFTLATLGPGSSTYMIMNTFANRINQELPEYEIAVDATGAGTRHQLDAARGDIDFYLTAPILQRFIENGEAMYAPIDDAQEVAGNLRSLFGFPLGYYHVVVYEDSGIESWEDIEGKRVFLGPPGGSAYRTSEMLVKGATGYAAGEDYEAVRLGWDSAFQSFQDGHIDVYFNPTLPPSPVITQLALAKKLRFLSLDETMLESEEIQTLSGQAGFSITTFPANLYGDDVINTGDITTNLSSVGLGTNRFLDEEVAYRMTKAFWESMEEIDEGAAWMRNISLDSAFTDLAPPLHEGAYRYYREIGLEVPEHLEPKP